MTWVDSWQNQYDSVLETTSEVNGRNSQPVRYMALSAPSISRERRF